MDVGVIGAGVVGLSAAAALARRGRSVVILERNEEIAREVTSRNSEVIHAGLYYPEGSIKARTCVAGREKLYERCRRLRIPHRRVGKLVVASADEEIPALERLLVLGRANGAGALERIDAAAVRTLEPAVAARAALLSPETGIVDAHAYALSFLAEAEAHGAELVRRAELLGIEHDSGAFRLDAACDGERQSIRTAAVVNAAGLGADRVAALAGLDVDALGYRIHPCKGDYFALSPGAPLSLSRLVYPVPSGPGLGVHATVDLGGRIRFGPDASFVEARDDHRVDPAKAVAFAAVVARYLPGCEASWLTPDFAGIRPRLAGPGESFRDFVVCEESARGLPGFVNLLGIESPGLTAAAALAEEAAALLA
ncbi:MAG: NAD(P)/FAD-dependent oxidoreductase [Myxococcales bacterium]|nr:NAD(P)/FAD-dependent oxidoreductase [Myxococcales bacterium]